MILNLEKANFSEQKVKMLITKKNVYFSIRIFSIHPVCCTVNFWSMWKFPLGLSWNLCKPWPFSRIFPRPWVLLWMWQRRPGTFRIITGHRVEGSRTNIVCDTEYRGRNASKRPGASLADYRTIQTLYGLLNN